MSAKLLKVSLINTESALKRDFRNSLDFKLYCFIAFLKPIGLSQISELASESLEVDASLPSGNNMGISFDHLIWKSISETALLASPERISCLSFLIFDLDVLNISILFWIASSTETEPIELLVINKTVNPTNNIPKTLSIKLMLSGDVWVGKW